MKLRKVLLAAPIMTAAIGFSQVAHADDWGCQVLLCLSDPRGPTTEAECRPPIEKLWRHLAKGRSFPSCSLAGSADSGTGSFARRVYDPYDPCPEGLVPAGGYVAQSESSDRRQWRRLAYGWSNMGRDTDDIYSTRNQGQRACVGKAVGSYTVNQGSDDYISVTVYDNIVWQPRQNPRAIDVFIDGKLHQRVRW